jgi:hypothetical protein
MKRALFLTMVILLVAGFATAKTPVTPITKYDLKDLKEQRTRQNKTGNKTEDRVRLVY